MKGGNGMVQALGAENRMLRNKIAELEQAQKEAMFIEMLTSQALGGFCSRADLTVEQAATMAIEAADLVMTKVMRQASEAMKAEKELSVQQPQAELADEESLIVKP